MNIKFDWVLFSPRVPVVKNRANSLLTRPIGPLKFASSFGEKNKIEVNIVEIKTENNEN